MHMEIGGVTDKFAHQVIDRRHQQVAALAQFGIEPLAATTGYGKITRHGETLDEMLAVGKAEGAIHDVSRYVRVKERDYRTKSEQNSMIFAGLCWIFFAPALPDVGLDDGFELLGDICPAQGRDFHPIDIDRS